jgi:hypothetical protein
MKKLIFIIMVFFAAIIVVSFNRKKTSIVGRVSPVDAAEVVWVTSTTDSAKSVVSMGQFNFDVKPGTYKLIIDAREPYKDVLMENLQVKQDQTLDVGEIPLKQ